MAKGASDTAGMPDLKKEYNQNSLGSTVGHVLKHVLVMGAMMGVIGLAAPAVAAAAGTGLTGSAALSATAGDMLVQTGYGSWEMLQMIGDTFEALFSIGGDVMGNVLEGDFAPSTWDSLVMSHGGESMAHGAVASHAPSVTFDEWLRNAQASGNLPFMLEDSESLGITLEGHMMNEYGHAGH